MEVKQLIEERVSKAEKKARFVVSITSSPDKESQDEDVNPPSILKKDAGNQFGRAAHGKQKN